MMLIIKYNENDEELSESLELFLIKMHNLFYFNYVPSLSIVNSILASGLSDAGMSGFLSWQPFEMTLVEYQEFIVFLKSNSVLVRGMPLRFIDVPENIKGEQEWIAWVMYLEMSIPFEKHLQLMQEEEKLSQIIKMSVNDNNSVDIMDVHMQWIQAANNLTEFSQPYMDAYKDKKD